MNRLIYLLFITTFVLTGCTSNDEKNRQLELLASNQSEILSKSIPIEYGALKILRVSSNENIVSMLMIYNDKGHSEKEIYQIITSSVKTYCNTSLIRKKMDLGLVYKIEIRNPRGKLITSELISNESCAP